MAGVPSHANEQAQQDSCVGVTIAFTVVSIIIVALRVFTRCFIVRNFGKDDVMMSIALLFAIGYMIAIFILKHNGMGFSGANLTPTQMVNLIQTTLAIQIMYYIQVYCIKVSILFVYMRFASEKHFRRAVIATISLLSVFVVICIIVCLVQCIPLHKMWDFTGMVKGHCINTTAFFYFTSSFNIVTDIWIIALPIKTLLSIQRPRREKAGLLAVFGLGVFSCIASIVRLHAIRIYTESKDPFYDSVPINLWSQVEVNIGIWCATIPALKALISKAQRQRTRSIAGAYKYHSKDKSGGTSSTRSGKITPSKFAAKMFGGSGSDESEWTDTQRSQGIGMNSLGTVVEHPRPVIRKESQIVVARDGSDEPIFTLGNDSKV